MKSWGGQPFWGLGYEFDPQWLLTGEERQRLLVENPARLYGFAA